MADALSEQDIAHLATSVLRIIGVDATQPSKWTPQQVDVLLEQMTAFRDNLNASPN